MNILPKSYIFSLLYDKSIKNDESRCGTEVKPYNRKVPPVNCFEANILVKEHIICGISYLTYFVGSYFPKDCLNKYLATNIPILYKNGNNFPQMKVLV